MNPETAAAVRALCLGDVDDCLRRELFGWQHDKLRGWIGAPEPHGDTCAYTREWKTAQAYVQPELVRLGATVQTFFFDADNSEPWAADLLVPGGYRCWVSSLGLPEAMCRAALIFIRDTRGNDNG